MYKQSEREKRLIQIFISFVEKALVPQIKKFNGSITEWNKFSTMLTNETVTELELYEFIDKIQIGSPEQIYRGSKVELRAEN